MTPPLRGTQENSGERARNLSGTAMRMLRRLAPMRFTVIAILALSVSGIAIAAISPRILGHATIVYISIRPTRPGAHVTRCSRI